MRLFPKGTAMKRLLSVTFAFFAVVLFAQNPAPAPVLALSAPSEQEIHQILVDRVDTYKRSVGIVVGTIGPQGTKVYSYGKLAADSPSVPDGNTVFEIDRKSTRLNSSHANISYAVF